MLYYFVTKHEILSNIMFCLYFIPVVLLDTTIEPSLRWTTYPYGPDANAAGVSLYNIIYSYIYTCIVYFLGVVSGGKKGREVKGKIVLHDVIV